MAWDNFEILESIDYSTNDYIKKLAASGGANAHAVLALSQKGGRGRCGRSWDGGQPGDNIALSLFSRLKVSSQEVSFVTLITALAVRDGIKEISELTTDIKYPNDLLYEGKKLCGILTELISFDEGGCDLVIGIGVNLNRADFPSELEDKAGSVFLASGKTFAAEAVARAIMKSLDIRLKRFETEGFKGQRAEYEAAMKVREGELESYDDIIKE